MSGRMIALAAGLAVAAGAAHAQDMAVLGKATFVHTCAPCHGSGPGDDGKPLLPGTQSLQWKYKGSKPAVLEQRTDLPAPVLRTFVRRGSWSMPAFRKTEITDAEIDAVAAYLAQSSKTPGATTSR